MIEIARIKQHARTGFANGGWCYDRYRDLAPLDARSKITVADLPGPGVIRHIHTTRHGLFKQFGPKELLARGVVLEIWYDDGERPAVSCPLADFFGDGCNGQASNFSSNLIESAPWSYNCYIPMPFQHRARVMLRNDTDYDTANYSFVEWEPLDRWDSELGYFHAAYSRKCLQLSRESDESFFRISGSGHIIGRQFSIVTDEPLFRDFMYVMEGNNEIDIDGEERVIDYLGTEDSFTFSWGFNELFQGRHAGMTLVDKGTPHKLSMYRFHDHLPIRFQNDLHWHINWRHEQFFIDRPEWAQAINRDGCWVDWATVFYWYQREANGFEHAELAPVDARAATLLKSSLPST